MSLQGDLSTLDLVGLFQNLEGGRKNGVLSIVDGRQATHLCFREGQLTALAYPDRPGVAEFLVAAGIADPAAIERARKSKRGGSLCEHLVRAQLVTREDLTHWIEARITDEACELLMTRSGTFEFHEGEVHEELFDADERELEIALAATPLLLEAARRADHWKLVRERIPSDSVHYELARQPKEAATPEAAELAAQVIALLDGTRSVGEIAAHFPHRRFELYELFSAWVATRTLRPCDPEALSQQIRALAGRDRKRAWELLERGLELDPRNLSLLTAKVELAEELGQLEDACEALKLVVHLELESGRGAEALTSLGKLKQLDANDPFVWEKSFELALSERRVKDALTDAHKLVELYRGPGLHRKACAVVERMIELAGETWELVRELAQLSVEAGDAKAAVAMLERYGQARSAEEDYVRARRVYEEILAIEPKNKSARKTLDEIASGEAARKRIRWRKLRRRVIAGACAAVILPALCYEGLARHAIVGATRLVLREDLIESGRYAEAAQRYRDVRTAWSWSTAACYELPQMITELEFKAATSPSARSANEPAPSGNVPANH